MSAILGRIAAAGTTLETLVVHIEEVLDPYIVTAALGHSKGMFRRLTYLGNSGARDHQRWYDPIVAQTFD